MCRSRLGPAHEQAGGRYYPKLQVAVPFSPVPGPRLLVKPGPMAEGGREVLIGALIGATERSGLSSLHITFCNDDEMAELTKVGFLHRLGCRYHWHNDGYGSFEDFLGALNSRKRKAIREGARGGSIPGLDIRALSGDAIEARHWDAFFAFYMDTGGGSGDRRTSRAASSRSWGATHGRQGGADHGGERGTAGRRRAQSQRRGLPLWAQLGLPRRFQVPAFRGLLLPGDRLRHRPRPRPGRAGAQGEHKIQRGYLPTATHSAHWIVDPRFREGDRRFSEARTPGAGERDGGTGGIFAVPAGATPAPEAAEFCCRQAPATPSWRLKARLKAASGFIADGKRYPADRAILGAQHGGCKAAAARPPDIASAAGRGSP